MEYSEEVKKLAEILKNSGLAASMKDALERAKSMLGKKETKKKEELFEKREDAAQTTLGEVNGIKDSKNPSEIKEKKEEIEESPEPKEELKTEEVFTNKADKQKQESPQNKVDYSKEKKVDLTDIFNVNK